MTVRLVDSAGATVDTTTTDADGYFEFIGTYSGTYTVKVDTASGELGVGTWDQTFDTDGLGSGDQATISDACRGCGRCVEHCPEAAVHIDIDVDRFIAEAEQTIARIIDLPAERSE